MENEPTLINDAGIPEEAPEEKEEKKQEEQVPEKEWTYIQIKPGETLKSLAEKYERPPDKILEKNKIHPNDIRFGYWVFV